MYYIFYMGGMGKWAKKRDCNHSYREIIFENPQSFYKLCGYSSWLPAPLLLRLCLFSVGQHRMFLIMGGFQKNEKMGSKFRMVLAVWMWMLFPGLSAYDPICFNLNHSSAQEWFHL